MKSVVVFTLIVVLCGSAKELKSNSYQSEYNGIAFNRNYGLVYLGTCGNIDVALAYRRAFYEFTTSVYKRIAIRTAGHFVFSPLSMWISLAALAEGTDGVARAELFNLLRLPEEKCIRQQYYAIASRCEPPGEDVALSRTRLFIFDEELVLNKQWENFVCSHWLIGIIRGTLRRNPMKALHLMRSIFAVQLHHLNLNGNSVILDTLDYDGLWTSAFQDATPERVPFYNDYGEKVGMVEMMRMKKRVKLAYLPEYNIKVLELPVGYHGRYRVMFGLMTGNSGVPQAIKILKSNLMFEVLQNLRISKIPLDVAIPRFSLSYEYDVRSILEEINVTNVWTDHWATRNISEPAALPTGFVQRVTVTFNRTGLNPYEHEITPAQDTGETGLHAEIGKDFIADRTFMFAAFDTETYTCLFT
ncbi:hypothetical protein O3G_MSEX007045, partial [Manduca sexta]